MSDNVQMCKIQQHQNHNHTDEKIFLTFADKGMTLHLFPHILQPLGIPAISKNEYITNSYTCGNYVYIIFVFFAAVLQIRSIVEDFGILQICYNLQ